MSDVFQTNNGSHSNNGHNGHNGFDVRGMFPQTFTLIDLMVLRRNKVSVSASVQSVLNTSPLMSDPMGWNDEEDFVGEDEQIKSLGHGKAHQAKRQAMPRDQRYLRMNLEYARKYKFACEQIVGVTGKSCLLRWSGPSMSSKDALPKQERTDWRFKKANRDGIVARSGEWKRHEVRRDRQLKVELNENDALARHEFKLQLAAWHDTEEYETAFEKQYAEEIAEELELQERYEMYADADDLGWDSPIDTMDDESFEDDDGDDFQYSVEAQAEWDDDLADMVTPWLDHVDDAKSETELDNEYLNWTLKRLPRSPQFLEAVEDSNPPIPRIGLRKSVVVEQKLPVQTHIGLRKLELRNPNDPKRRRAEISERKRKEIRDGRKMKAESSAP